MLPPAKLQQAVDRARLVPVLPCVGAGIGGENRKGLGDQEMKTES